MYPLTRRVPVISPEQHSYQLTQDPEPMSLAACPGWLCTWQPHGALGQAAWVLTQLPLSAVEPELYSVCSLVEWK